MSSRSAAALALATLFLGVTAGAPESAAAALRGAAIGARLDYGSTSATGKTDGSVSVLLLWGSYDFGRFRGGVDVPVGFWDAPDGGDNALDIGNLTAEIARRIDFGRGMRLDARLRLYVPTFSGAADGADRLGHTASTLRPDEAPMWAQETLTLSPRARFGLDLLHWLEFGLGGTLHQAVIADEMTTSVHVFSDVRARLTSTGRMSVGYGAVDRLDAEEPARSWIVLNGGFDDGELAGGLEVRLRQAPESYVDALGAQFAFYLGGHL